MSRPLLVALAITLGGCAAMSGKTDYRDYRTVHLADEPEDRTRAMARYLERNPNGRWAAELRQEYEADEAALFEENKSSREGLAFYLEAYPSGRFRDQAEARLQALASVQASRQEGEGAAQEVRREQREEALRARRLWATQAVSFWSRILLGIDKWGEAIPEVAASSPEFDRAFGAAPRPRCSSTECIKFYQLDFAIPVPGQTRIERTLRLLLRLHLAEGRLVRAEMLMPERGFSRWYELENQEFIIDEDPEARNMAVEWALARIVPIVREVAPNAAAIDVVPEPITAPRVRAPNQPDPGASQIPGQAGGEGASGPAEATEIVEGPAESLVLPLALQGLQAGNLRIVVFAASEDDVGAAYDGLFVELEVPEPAPTPAPARRGRR